MTEHSVHSFAVWVADKIPDAVVGETRQETLGRLARIYLNDMAH